MTIHDLAESTLPQMIEHRRYLHMHPEESFHEEETYQYILEYLQAYDTLKIREKVGGGGIRATLGTGSPHIAIRADFDALPIQDEKDVPYKSTVDGIMHACGHDGHTSTLFALLDLVARQEKAGKLKGAVSFIFQFAEEIQPGGAVSMVADDVLEGVDKVYGQHYWSQHPTHTVKVKPGPMISSPDYFVITIKGKGGHAAQPHDSVDPVLIAAEVITNLQSIVSRQISPIENAVVTFGKVRAGTAFNIIPDTAEIVGTVRTFKPEIKDQIHEIFQREVEYTAKKRGAEGELLYNYGYPAVINHEREAEVIEKAALELGLPFETAKPLMIGEDFSYYILEKPGAFFLTGSGNHDKNSTYLHHHPMFDLDEDAMISGLSMFMKILEIEQVIEWN